MKKQVTGVEMVMMLVGPLVGAAACLAARDLVILAIRRTGIASDLLLTVLYYVAIVAAPCFVLVFVSSLVQSWRYKSVNGVLSVFVLIGLQVAPVIRLVDSFVGSMYAMVHVATALSAGVLALIPWRHWRRGVIKKTAGLEVRNTVLEAEPKASVFLRVLALVSVPLVFITLLCSSFITVGFSVLVLFLLSQAPRIPVALIAAGFFAPILAVWANFVAIKSIVRPKPARTLSVALSAEAHPEVRRLVDQVAADVGTRTADHIILNTHPGFLVSQGSIETMDGVISGRILSLGLSSLRELTAGELKSVLAHEFAHFSGGDTVYSLLVSPVYRGIGSAVMSLRQGTTVQGLLGAAIFVLQLPAVHFMMSFHEYFAGIDSMLSRNRELRADWIAAQRYGKQPFVSALEKVSVEGPLFDLALANLELRRDDELFQKVESTMQSFVEGRARITAELAEYTETEFDSHPSLRTRRESLPETTTRVEADSGSLRDSFGEEEQRLSAHAVGLLGINLVEA